MAMRFRRAALTATLLAAALGLASPASAQDKYKLEDAGFQKVSQVDPNSPEGKLQDIRRKIAEDKAEEARDLADAWIEQYPNHPLLVEAYLVRGDAKVADRDEYKALFDYEYVVRGYPGSEQFNIALEREFEIAKLYSAGLKRRFLGVRMFEAFDEAQEIMIRIQERVPGSELGEKASMALGDHYFAQAEMTSAAEAYGMFLVNYPRSRQRERALLRVIQSNLATFKGPMFDATGLIEASERLKQYQQEYPAAAERIGADALLVRIDESMALKSYYNAGWYAGRGKTWSATTMYQRVIRDYPQTAAARASAERLANMNASVVAPKLAPIPIPRDAAASDKAAATAPASAPVVPGKKGEAAP